MTDIEDRGAEARRRLEAAGLLEREERSRPERPARRTGRPTPAELAWAERVAPADVDLSHLPGRRPKSKPEPMSEAELIARILGKPGRL
jgi:hypothetical protein